MKKERVPVVISKGMLPSFPHPKRQDFMSELERIRTICILSWVKAPKCRPEIDVIKAVIE